MALLELALLLLQEYQDLSQHHLNLQQPPRSQSRPRSPSLPEHEEARATNPWLRYQQLVGWRAPAGRGPAPFHAVTTTPVAD